MTVSRRGFLTTVLLVFVVILAYPATAWLQESAANDSMQSPTPPDMEPPTQTPGVLAVPGKKMEEGEAVDGRHDETDAAERGTGTQSAGPDEYIIRENDTLWDIAAERFRDPFLWPLLWQANPSIENPDLIYPGKPLVIPSLAPIERAMSAPRKTPQEPMMEEKAAGEKTAPETKALVKTPVTTEPEVPSFFRKERILSTAPEPEEPETGSILVLPEDTIPAIVDRFMMLSAGFVSEEEEESKDYIIGSADDPDKSILSHDEKVYISIHSDAGVKVGDRFLIYQAVHDVKHPVTKRYYGELFRVIGILKVIKVNESGSTTATASIIKSFDFAEKGSLLTPYQEPTLVFPVSVRPAKDLAGHILDVTDKRTINAQTDYVFLDKGMDDGVEAGDRFIVYADGGNGSGVSKALGEVEVFLVKKRTATAIVRKSVDAMSRGDRYTYKN